MTEHPVWGDRPYHSFDYEMKRRFGEKLYKVALDAGMTCPNRDGKLDTHGCSFCSGSGSGDFTMKHSRTITEQINQGIEYISRKKQTGHRYIAYFQAFTNTYAPVDKLRLLYEEALSHPSVAMLSIATRPDCLPGEVITLLQECCQKKPVMVELGLQTIHEETARHIRRGYSLDVYDQAVRSLKNASLEVVTHVIAGLPGETKEDFLQTTAHTAACGSDGIKLQLLYILKYTDLAEEYINGMYRPLEMDEYLDWILSALRILPERMTIHRLTGDGPKDLLLAPLWSRNKRNVLNTLHKTLKEKHIWQGQAAHPGQKGIESWQMNPSIFTS